MRTHALRAGVLMACAIGVTLSAQTFVPPVLQAGALPTLSPLSAEVGGGQVLAELTIAADGKVGNMRALRETESFTERVLGYARDWTFTPAKRTIDPARLRPGEAPTQIVTSKVLVAGVFRPPTLVTPTLGEPIRDVATPSDDVAYPVSIVTPGYPPMAKTPGIVLVEVRVDAKGGVAGVSVRQSAPPFDALATNAALQWRFRAAHIDGADRASIAYIIFGFAVPRP